MMQYAKAAVAAVLAGLSALATAVNDGTVSMSEWVTVAIAFFVALAAVWGVPNAKPPQPVGGQIPPTTTSTGGNVKVIKTGEQGGVLPPPQ